MALVHINTSNLSCYWLQAPEALMEGKKLKKLTASLDIYTPYPNPFLLLPAGT